MALLSNEQHERFAQEIASGARKGTAYREAGYAGHQSGASALLKNPKIINRIEELRGRKVATFVVNRQYLTEAAIENLEKALGRKPVKLGREGKETYVYKGDVANRVLQMLGSEFNLFIERQEHRHSIGEFEKYSDAELVQMLANEAQALIEDHSQESTESGTENSSE